MKPALVFYPDMFDGVEVWRIECPIIHWDVGLLEKIHPHCSFVYWSIVLLEDVFPKGVMDSFKDWKQKVLNKLEIDTIVD